MSSRQSSPDGPRREQRVPPSSDEAERGLLGAILLDSERVVDLCVERLITAESFYSPAHRCLYELVLEMNQQGRAIDLLTVSDRVRSSGAEQTIGGLAFLEELIDSTPTAAHAEHYVDIVHQKHVLRTIIDKSRNAIDRCYAEDEEAESILGEVEQSFFEVANMERGGNRPWPELVKHSMQEIETIFQNKKPVSGISTGYKDLDSMLLGMQPSDMIILAARPSMGKTSLALNVGLNIALGRNADHKPRPVAVFSLEMSSEQLVKRLICSHARVSGHTISKGIVTAENHRRLMSAADEMLKAEIVLDDTPGLSALELRSRARRLQRKHGIEFIVVDYLQLMNYPQYAREGRQREVGAISGALKAMAKELKLPVLVLSQLSRAPETRSQTAVPKMSDLRDSGSIEQDADVVALLRRPCRYPEDPEHDDRRLAILDIAKHRNGPTGEVRLNFEEDYMRFEDRLEPGVDGAYNHQAAAEEVEAPL